MTKPPECGAERPGPYPALCRQPSRHRGDCYGHYGGFAYTWERATRKELPELLAEFVASGGDVTDLATVMAMREAVASAAIDRDEHARTYTVETRQDETQ